MEEWYHQTDSNTTNQICHANINVSRSLLEPGGFSIFGDVSPLFLGQLLVDVMNFCKVQWELKLDMLRSYWDLIVFPESQALPKSPNQGIPPNPKTENLHLKDFIRLGVRVLESLPMLEERLVCALYQLHFLTWKHDVNCWKWKSSSKLGASVRRAVFWSVGEALQSFFVQPQEKRQTLFYLEASVWGLLDS